MDGDFFQDDDEILQLSVQTHDFAQQINEFEHLLSFLQIKSNVNDTNQQHSLFQHLTTKALSGNLSQSSIRSIIWKLFLGILPYHEPEEMSARDQIQEWISTLQKERERYEVLRKKHENDPRKSFKQEDDNNIFNSDSTNEKKSLVTEEEDVTFMDPLSSSQSNPWSEYFENSELERIITQDLKRLYPEYPFFRTENIQAYLHRLLFIWSKENQTTSYRQGIHELLAPILLVVYRDAQNLESIDPKLIQDENNKEEENQSFYHKCLFQLLDRTYLEHDSYILFERVMIKMAPFFAVKSENNPKITKNVNMPATIGVIGPNEKIGSTKSDTVYETPIYKICHKIQYTILEKKDPDLYSHLIRIGIEPTLYLLRWVRLLFGREFHIDDVLILWDAIFADSGGFNSFETCDFLSLVEHIAISMLHYIRSHLLSGDQSQCLRRLMKYPPVEDVHIFVEQALESRARPNSKLPEKGGNTATSNNNSGGVSHLSQIGNSIDQNSSNSSNLFNNNNTDVKDTKSLFPRSSGNVPVTEKTIKSSKLLRNLSSPNTGNNNSGSNQKQQTSNNNNNGSLTSSFTKTLSNIYGKSKSIKPLIGTTASSSSLSPNVSSSNNSSPVTPSFVIEKEYIEKEKKLGNVVEAVIGVLQHMVIENEMNQEDMLMSVAELKHVRDCLLFQLPFIERPLDWITSSNTTSSSSFVNQITTTPSNVTTFSDVSNNNENINNKANSNDNEITLNDNNQPLNLSSTTSTENNQVFENKTKEEEEKQEELGDPLANKIPIETEEETNIHSHPLSF
ncbi:hypothetical protein ABK040_004027 [Willaertia magna]